MISPIQCIAARSILRLSHDKLARQIGVSWATVSRFEKGESEDAKTIKALEAFFDREGIEFLPNHGVALKSVKSYTLEGQAGFREFFDEVYETARDEGGDFCIFNGMPNRILKYAGEEWYQGHADRMTKIKDNFSFRVFIREGEKSKIGKSFAEYREFPKDRFHEEMIYIYGTKVAVISFGQEVKVLVIDQPDFTASQRVLFDLAWEQSV